MNVRCPECETIYRVDPAKIPETGIRARCMRCSGEFEILREDREPAGAEAVPAGEATGVGAVGAEVETAAVVGPADDQDLQVVAEGELAPSPFGSTDPRARARRLARALVSDILVYHRERRDRSLREGNIRQEFRDEIRKSWDEYVSQVGNEIARETSYFQEALNEILAGGARSF